MRQAGSLPSPGVVVRFPQLSRDWSKSNPMDRADLYRVYELGAAIGRLDRLTNATQVGDFFGILITAQNALTELLGAAPQAKIELCAGDARALKGRLDEIDATHYRDSSGNLSYPQDGNKTVGPYHVWAVGEALQSFQAVFRAEMQSAATYWVPTRGSRSTRHWWTTMTLRLPQSCGR